MCKSILKGQTGHITGQMGRVPGTDGRHTRGCPAKILYVYWFFLSPKEHEEGLADSFLYLLKQVLPSLEICLRGTTGHNLLNLDKGGGSSKPAHTFVFLKPLAPVTLSTTPLNYKDATTFLSSFGCLAITGLLDP